MNAWSITAEWQIAHSLLPQRTDTVVSCLPEVTILGNLFSVSMKETSVVSPVFIVVHIITVVSCSESGLVFVCVSHVYYY